MSNNKVIKVSVKKVFNGIWEPSKCNVSSNFETMEFDISNTEGLLDFKEISLNQITASAIFKDGYTNKENFISQDHIVLDFDELGDKTYIELKDEFNKMGLSSYMWASKSHKRMKEGKGISERYHVLVLLETEITNSDNADEIIKHLIDKFNADPCATSCTRRIYPSYKSGEPILSADIVNDTNKCSIIELDLKDDDTIIDKDNIKTDSFDPTNLLIEIEQMRLERIQTLQNTKIEYNDMDKNNKCIEQIVEYLSIHSDEISGSKGQDHKFIICASLYNEYGEKAYDMVRKIRDTDGMKRRWDSAKTGRYGRVSIASLIYVAKIYGWTYQNKRENVMELDLIKEELERIKKMEDQIENSDMTTIEKGKQLQILEDSKTKLQKEKENIIKTNTSPYQTDIVPTEDNRIEYFNSFVAKINGSDDVVIEMKSMVIIKSIREATSIFEDIGYYEKSKFNQSFMSWRQSSDKRTIYRDQIVYKTHSKLLPGEINTFRQKYAVERVKCNQQSIKPILDYILYSLCDSNNELYKFMTQWIAAVIQYYSTKVLVINIGDKGTGKTTLFELLMAILGDEKALIAKDERQLLGNFNKLIENKIFLTLDEIADLSDKRVANGFKSLITGSKIIIEPKGRDAYSIPNTANWYIASNGFDTNNVDLGDRRYVVLSSSDRYNEKFDKVAHTNMFESVYKIIGNSKYTPDHDILGQVLDYFLDIKVDLNTFLENIPITNLKREIKSNNLDSIQNFLVTIYIEDGKIYDNTNKCVIDVYNNKVIQSDSGVYDGNIVVKTQMIYDIFKHLTNDRKTNYNSFCKRITEVTNVKQLSKDSIKVRQFDKQKIYEYFKVLGLETYLLD